MPSLAKLSLSPLYVEADTRRFGFRTFSNKERPFFDINFISDICPTIEIFALEFDRVIRQSRDLFRGTSLGAYSLFTKLSIASIFCSFVNTKVMKKDDAKEFLLFVLVLK